MTVHKVQGATLDTVLVNIADQISAPILYTAMTRVRQLQKLFFLSAFNVSLYLSLSFPPQLHLELKRLKSLERATAKYIREEIEFWTRMMNIFLVSFFARFWK